MRNVTEPNMPSNTPAPPIIPAATCPRLVLHRQLEPEFGVPWSNVHLLRLEKAGKFPKRVRLGANTIAWVASELGAWNEARIAQSRAA
jgi:prophage regulatory protein